MTKLKPGHEIVECTRCYLRYEEAESTLPCPHCSDACVGVGNSFDSSCADALKRVGELVSSADKVDGQKHVWSVGDHFVHVARIQRDTMIHVVVVHRVRLRRESANAC